MEKKENASLTRQQCLEAEAETASFQLLECEWWTNSYSCLLRQTLDKRGGTTQRKESSWDLTRTFFLLPNISSIGVFFLESPTRLEGRLPIRIQWAGINMIHNVTPTLCHGVQKWREQIKRIPCLILLGWPLWIFAYFPRR